MDDKTRMGRSKIIPYKEGERATERHARRLRENLKHADDLLRWCGENNIAAKILNRGHHWIFSLPSGDAVEWWPSSAKLVVNKQWGCGIHTHDFEQCRRVIAKHMGIETEPAQHL